MGKVFRVGVEMTKPGETMDIVRVTMCHSGVSDALILIPKGHAVLQLSEAKRFLFITAVFVEQS